MMKRSAHLSALFLPAILAIASPGCSGDDPVCAAPLATCGDACVDFRFDTGNCGACGVTCDAGSVCDNGTCNDTCSSPLSRCDDTCVDTGVDPSNCGGCGNVCASGQFCSAGTCGFSCAGGTTQCGDLCVDTATDENNCGMCGTMCGTGETCVASICVPGCDAGLELCDNACIDPLTDPMNCGGCGTVCGATQVCALGNCADVNTLGYVHTTGYDATFGQDLVAVQDFTLALTKVNPVTFESDTVIDYAVVPDGSVVLVAAQDTEGVIELYHAATPGAALTKLNAPLVADGDVQPGIVVSADGSKVLYRADQDADEVIDLFSVDIANPGVTTKLNPALDTDEDVDDGMQLSADGTQVVYRADHETEGLVEAFTVDLANPGVATKVSGAVTSDVREVAITSTGDAVVYRARQEGNNDELFFVEVATPTVNTRVNGNQGSGAFVQSFQLTHDDSRAVWLGSDGASNSAVWVSQLSTTPNPTRLSVDGGEGFIGGDITITQSDSHVFYRSDGGSGTRIVAVDLMQPEVETVISAPADDFVSVQDFVLSADDNHIVYRQRVDGGEGGLLALFQVDVATPGDATRLTPSADDGEVSSGYAVTADGSRVLYRADFDVSNRVDAFVSSIASPGTRVNLGAPVQRSPDIEGLTLDDANHAYVIADRDIEERNELFRVDLQTPGTYDKVNADLPPGADVREVRANADGSAVVYRADADTSDQEDLYFVDTANLGMSTRVNPPAATDAIDFFDVSSDGSTIVYTSSHEGVRQVYAVLANNLGVEIKLNPALVSGGAVSFGPVFVSPDGASVIYVASQDQVGKTELYEVAVANPGVATKLSPSALAGSVTTFLVSHDRLSVAYTVQDLGGKVELFRVLRATPGVSQPLSAPLPANGDVSNYAFSHDDSFVVYRADPAGRSEIFRVPSDGPTTVTTINEPMNSGNVSAFVISPDDGQVVYRSNHVNNRNTLYHVDLASPGVATAVHPVPTSNAFAVSSTFRFSLDSLRVIYFGDLIQNFRDDLYVTPVASLGTRTMLNPPSIASNFSDVRFDWDIAPNGQVVFSHRLVGREAEVFAAEPAVPGVSERMSPWLGGEEVSSVALFQ